MSWVMFQESFSIGEVICTMTVNKLVQSSREPCQKRSASRRDAFGGHMAVYLFWNSSSVFVSNERFRQQGPKLSV